MKVEESVVSCGNNHNCNISRYTEQLVTTCSMKKMGPYNFVFHMAQKTFTFGESLSCSTMACRSSVPHTLTLCRFTFPDRWKVASSLNINIPAKSSLSSIVCCIRVQKSNRRA
ncbi:hypothetical protein AVEN_230702-1 [Araneus ventricosus]|uniref:Uncharacterized protein n=1 Tax=Araneus ventricosus TaxID=182803 RepID=A0A4Y2A426_ARAVE|nr:hypothetical protein AVEN_230702-1 [Araneus ventricosus]